MECELRFWTFPFRAPEVTHQDQLASAIDHRLDRGERHAYAPIVGDRACVVLGHVEVNPHQNGFTATIDICNAFLGHGFPLLNIC
jgi:hypothetical protein